MPFIFSLLNDDASLHPNSIRTSQFPFAHFLALFSCYPAKRFIKLRLFAWRVAKAQTAAGAGAGLGRRAIKVTRGHATGQGARGVCRCGCGCHF